MISGGVSASQNKWAGPPPGLHSDCQDSAFYLFFPGQDAGQGSGGATQGTAWGWNRRAGESPGQVSELDRTQLSQDLGGGTLAIDKLPDNGTRVVVSAGGTQRGREVVVGRAGALVPLANFSDPQVYPLGSILEVSVERGLPREGKEAQPSLGQKILASQSFIGCLPSCRLREVQCLTQGCTACPQGSGHWTLPHLRASSRSRMKVAITSHIDCQLWSYAYLISVPSTDHVAPQG